MDLPTRDILNKQILSTGTFWGQGSPPEGDTYTVDDLDGLVSAAAAIPSLHRPMKLGHNKEQRFIAKDGWPAVGWLDNLRREGEKLYADIRKVPEKLADLIDSGGYRGLSPERSSTIETPTRKCIRAC